jgi:hypothetical protein
MAGERSCRSEAAGSGVSQKRGRAPEMHMRAPSERNESRGRGDAQNVADKSRGRFRRDDGTMQCPGSIFRGLSRARYRGRDLRDCCVGGGLCTESQGHGTHTQRGHP